MYNWSNVPSFLTSQIESVNLFYHYLVKSWWQCIKIILSILNTFPNSLASISCSLLSSYTAPKHQISLQAKYSQKRIFSQCISILGCTIHSAPLSLYIFPYSNSTIFLHHPTVRSRGSKMVENRVYSCVMDKVGGLLRCFSHSGTNWKDLRATFMPETFIFIARNVMR